MTVIDARGSGVSSYESSLGCLLYVVVVSSSLWSADVTVCAMLSSALEVSVSDLLVWLRWLV